MLSSRFLQVSFFAAVLFLTSCNGTEEKTNTDEAGSDTTATAANAEPVAVSTIVTSPENMLLIRHKVKDFAKWKAAYEGHDSARLAVGIHNYVLGRGVGDSNMVLVAIKVDDIAKAKSFAKDPKLKQAMQKGGVTGPPSFRFTTMTFQDTVHISSDIRSLTTFAVKGWDAWQKGFEDGKQERLDNGITVRAYGHDPDDSNKVAVVTAVVDTAKAYAFWKSDMLKKRRAANGVIGEPERFVFRVVQRY